MPRPRQMTSPYAPGSGLPDDFDQVPRYGGGGGRSRPPPSYRDPGAYNADPYSSHGPYEGRSLRDRYNSPPPSAALHRGRQACTFSPQPQHRAYSPPRRTFTSPRRAYSPPPRGASPPPTRRYEPDPEPRRRVKEPRGRRAYSPEPARDFRSSSAQPRYRDDRDYRASRSNPPYQRRPSPSRRYASPSPHRSSGALPRRYQSPPRRRHESPPPRRYQSPGAYRSTSAEPRQGRHRSVPPARSGGGGGRKQRSSSQGNQMWAQAASTALKAGAAAAYKVSRDDGTWGEKGAKVATAAIGAALVDTFMGKKYPKKVGGVRHKAMRQVAEVALGKAVAEPALQGARRRR